MDFSIDLLFDCNSSTAAIATTAIQIIHLNQMAMLAVYSFTVFYELFINI